MPFTRTEFDSEPYAGGTLHYQEAATDDHNPRQRTAFWFGPGKEDMKCLNRLELNRTCSIPCTAGLYVCPNGQDKIPVVQLSQHDFVKGTEFRCRAAVRHEEADGSRWNWTGTVECGLVVGGSAQRIEDYKGTQALVSEIRSTRGVTPVGRFELQIPGYRPTGSHFVPQIGKLHGGMEAWVCDDYLADRIYLSTYHDEGFWPEALRVSILPESRAAGVESRFIPSIRYTGDSFARSIVLRGFGEEAEWHARNSTLVDCSITDNPKAYSRKRNATFMNTEWDFQLAWRVPEEIQSLLDMSSAATE